MGLFSGKKKDKKESKSFKSGEKVATYFFGLETKIGTYLNEFQHKIGFKARNYLLLTVGIILLMLIIFN